MAKLHRIKEKLKDHINTANGKDLDLLAAAIGIDRDLTWPTINGCDEPDELFRIRIEVSYDLVKDPQYLYQEVLLSYINTLPSKYDSQQENKHIRWEKILDSLESEKK
jgi:hypothetical protein